MSIYIFSTRNLGYDNVRKNVICNAAALRDLGYDPFWGHDLDLDNVESVEFGECGYSKFDVKGKETIVTGFQDSNGVFFSVHINPQSKRVRIYGDTQNDEIVDKVKQKLEEFYTETGIKIHTKEHD